MESSPPTNKFNTETAYLGCVKWFNNKKGCGYVSIKNGPLIDEDIFVHYSCINVDNNCFKYLVQGEYVNIIVNYSTKPGRSYQASYVGAPCTNGVLMCETRATTRDTTET